LDPDGRGAACKARGLDAASEFDPRLAVAARMEVSAVKDTEDALSETQRLLLDAQRISGMRAWEEDLRTGVVKMDLAMLGDGEVRYGALSREEAWNLIHPADRERLMELRRRTIEIGGPFETEYRMLRPDGVERVMLARGELLRDAAGRPERIVGTALDITDRKHAEEEAERSQRLLRLVLDTLPVGVAVLDEEANTVMFNPAFKRIWEDAITSAAARYAKSVGYRHGTTNRIQRDEWGSQRALRKGETNLNELVDIDTFGGRKKIIGNSAAPIRDERGAIVGAVVVNEDVTERVNAEDALRESQKLLVEAQALGRIGSWEQDLAGGAIQSSDENERLFFGEGGRGHHLDDYAHVVHPDDMSRVMESRGRMVEGQPGEIEYRVVRPDGSVRWIFARATVLRDEQGRPARIHGINADITERKLAEEELARRARQQSALAQLSLAALKGDGIQALFDEATAVLTRTLDVEYGMVLEWRPEQEQMEFRAGAGPWVDEALREVRPRALPGFMAWFNLRSQVPLVVEDLPAETRFVPCELLMAHGVKSGITVPITGKERPFGVLAAATKAKRRFRDDQVQFVWSVANVLATSIEQARAAAELDEKREQLRALSRKLIEAQEAERRAVARELHDDFGQVLTALRLNLQRRTADESENIALVDGAIARMRDLAQDLRPPQLDELGLEASLRWYVERETARAGLQLELDLQPLVSAPVPVVATTAFRVIQEALTNVIRHARARRVRIALGPVDGHLELSVGDDGAGFDVADARKRAARGGSLGLLGMQERVELVGGDLHLDSAPGRGTTVQARLPLAGGSSR
ncbi:MAG: PAS domain-containing protein, partial [Myxococcales bacterium]